jgi:hypothetical protein
LEREEPEPDAYAVDERSTLLRVNKVSPNDKTRVEVAVALRALLTSFVDTTVMRRSREEHRECD